jgi:nucleoside-diphosphate-sugar epimerase
LPPDAGKADLCERLLLRPSGDPANIGNGAIESLRRNPKSGATFNIGSGESYSVAEVAEMVRSAANVGKPFVSLGNRRVNDIPDVIAEFTAIRDQTGWSPSITLQQGLRDVVAHAKAHGGSGAVV